MDDLFREIYYNPATGFSTQKLYEELKKRGKIYTMKQVQDFVKRQEVSQITSPLNKKIVYPPITGPQGTYQTDLMFLKDYKHQNSHYKIIIGFIEVTSRKVYCYPLKKKDIPNVTTAYKQFLKDIDNKIVALTSDNGTEFTSGEFQKIDKDHNIQHYYVQPNEKTAVGKIERFWRTLRGKITKYQQAYKTLNWVNVLPDLISNYNNSVHSSTGYKPNEVNEKRAAKIRARAELRKSYALNFVHTFKVGDKVRMLKSKGMFQKGTQTFTKSIYTVQSIDKLAVVLKNEKGTIKRAKPYLLKKIDEVQTAPDKPEIEKHDFKENARQNREKNRLGREPAFQDRLNRDTGKVELKEREKPAQPKRVEKVVDPFQPGVKIKAEFKVKGINKWFEGVIVKKVPTGYKCKFPDGNTYTMKKHEIFLVE